MLDPAVKNFYSDKDLSRFDYLLRSCLIIGCIFTAHFLYTVRFTHRNTSSAVLWALDIIAGGGLLAWTLSKKIVTHIKLDLNVNKFIVEYITIFSDDKTIEVPFEFLTFEFNKEPTRSRPGNRKLKIYSRKKVVFSIETGEDGFSQETLEELIEELKKLGLSNTGHKL